MRGLSLRRGFVIDFIIVLFIKITKIQDHGVTMKALGVRTGYGYKTWT